MKTLCVNLLLAAVWTTCALAQTVVINGAGGSSLCTVTGSQTSGYVLTASDNAAACAWQSAGVTTVDANTVKNAWFLTDGGTANAVTGTTTTAFPVAYATGQAVIFKAAATNTTATTININSLGAKNLTKAGAAALAAGNKVSGVNYLAVYDGTQFQLVGYTQVAADIPTLNQNTSGTAANLSGTPALPNGTTATTQAQADASTKLATTAYVDTGLATKGPGTVTSVILAGTSNQITATGTCTITTTGTCTLSLPSGLVLPGTVNGLTITTTTGTLTIAAAKVATVNNSLTLAGTDGVTLTFPTTSATIARTDAAQTFTGTQTFSSTIAGSVNGNSATATALAANGTNCTGGNYPLGVDASGNSETCTALSAGAKTSQGTTVTVYHGNAGGDGSFAVVTPSDAAGNTSGSGSFCLTTSCAMTTPNLGTPSAATLTSATGLPISTGVSGLGTGIAAWLATPSSANLATAITDETGSGLAVFGTSPTIVTPTIASFTNATHNHTNAAGGGTLTLAGAAFANQGTTTTLLHGNGAGNPSFGAVALASDVSGTLPQANVDAAVPHCYKGTAAVSGANMSVTDAITGGVTNTALAAATTQNLTLFTLPAQGKVVALSIKPSTIFAGGAVSELTMSVGPASCSNAGSAGVAQCYAPSVTSGTVQSATGAAYGLFTAVANTNMFDVGGLSSSTFASHAVQVQFTSTGANMSALTAGAVDIRACIVTLP